jgi:hypothetical protein
VNGVGDRRETAVYEACRDQSLIFGHHGVKVNRELSESQRNWRSDRMNWLEPDRTSILATSPDLNTVRLA